MDDGSDGRTFSLANLKSTAGWILLIVALAAFGLIGASVVFKGHVQF
jgi:hypothetical protein